MAHLYRRCPRSAGRVYPMTRRQWLDAATSQIRFPLDRERVRQELEAHIEDRMDAAQARGMTVEDAESHALAAMGDPVAIAPELGRLHSPWLGRLWWAIRAVAAAVLVVTIVSFTDPGSWHNFLGSDIPAMEIPPAEYAQDALAYSRTGLWESLDLGTVGGYRFHIPVAYAQRLEVTGEHGYTTYSMELQLMADTWRVWEPWEPDMDCISVTDNTGCVYMVGSDPRTAEPLTPYFLLSSLQNGPGRSGMNLFLDHMPQTPEWLELTIGDTVLHIDLQGGGLS